MRTLNTLRRVLIATALVSSIASLACSGSETRGTTGPSGLPGVGGSRAGTLSTEIPNSSFEGTGTNPGLGSPNSCTDAVPAIQNIGSNAEFIKIVLNKVDGLTRGYQFRITPKDGSKPSRTFDTIEREWQGKPSMFDPGQYLAEGRARRAGCAKEFGEWSKAKEFHITGDVNPVDTEPVIGGAPVPPGWFDQL